MEKSNEEIIQVIASGSLLEEIKYFIETSHDEEWEPLHDICSAFDLISERAEDMTDGWKSYRAECRKIKISLGEYVEMSQDEINRTITSSGQPWDFNMKGKAYRLKR